MKNDDFLYKPETFLAYVQIMLQHFNIITPSKWVVLCIRCRVILYGMKNVQIRQMPPNGCIAQSKQNPIPEKAKGDKTIQNMENFSIIFPQIAAE